MSRYRLLKRMLHAKGYNLPEVAELLGMSASSVSRRFRAVEPFNSDEMYTLMDAACADYGMMNELFPKGGIK